MYIEIKKFKKNCFEFDTNVEEALIRLSKLKRKVILVTKKNFFCGTVTDGDIRKNFYSTKNTIKLEDIMNNKPKFLRKDFIKKDIKKIKKKNIRYVPVLNKSKKIINLIDLWGSENQSYKNEVIILAGGFGKRLRPYTNKIPKPMLKINNTPHLETLIKKINAQGFNNISILLFYKHSYIIKEIKKIFPRNKISFIKEKKPLGTAGGLSNVKFSNKFPPIIINADLITSLDIKNLMYYHKIIKSDFTVSIKQKMDKIPFATVHLKKNIIVSIEEKPSRDFFFNAGIYMVEQKILRLLKKNKRIDMPDLIKLAIKKKNNIRAFNMYEDWMDYGSKEIYEKLNN